MNKFLMTPLMLVCSASFSLGDVTVKPAGLQIVWDDGAEQFGGFKTFNSAPGVKMALILKTDADQFIGLDQQKTKVELNGVKSDCWFFGSSGISKDGQYLKLDVFSKGAEDEGGKVEAKGELLVSTASGKGQTSTGMIEWKKGVKVQFPEDSGLPKFTVDKVGKPKWGDEKWEVTLKCNKDFEKFISIKFIDENGKEHEAKRGGWSSMGFMGKKTVTVSYKAAEEISKAKMVVEVWKGVKKVKVPVQLSLDLTGVNQ